MTANLNPIMAGAGAGTGMKIHEQKVGAFRWVDVVGASAAEFRKLAQEHDLSETIIKDFMDPKHLPKVERFGNAVFLITRGYDVSCRKDADEIHELTRKVAIFARPGLVLTSRRKDQPFLETLRQSWPARAQEAAIPEDQLPMRLVGALLLAAAQSYESPLDSLYEQLEGFEIHIFQDGEARTLLREGYYLKRKAWVYRRMLRLSFDVIPKLAINDGPMATHWADIRETLERLVVGADELQEGADSLLNLHLSLASHRTNEIVRILTVFSVFFLPLSFIAGIYGMNFEHMPELKTHYGYPMVIFTMVVVCLSILYWFRRKGWLK